MPRLLTNALRFDPTRTATLQRRVRVLVGNEFAGIEAAYGDLTPHGMFALATIPSLSFLQEYGRVLARAYRAGYDRSLYDAHRPLLARLGVNAVSDITDVTDTQRQAISDLLRSAAEKGQNPRKIATELARKTGLSKDRALRIARHELISMYAEGQLDALEAAGVSDVTAQVEWVTAGDSRVCPRCSAMEGKVFKISEARGKIPLHVNCRCAWVPAEGISLRDEPATAPGPETPTPPTAPTVPEPPPTVAPVSTSTPAPTLLPATPSPSGEQAHGPSDNYTRAMPNDLAAKTKAVDPKTGQVLTFYTGSARKFEGNLLPTTGDDNAEAALYVTESKATAANYTDEKTGQGEVVAVRIYTENPLDATKPLTQKEAKRIAKVYAKYPTLAPKAPDVIVAADKKADGFTRYQAISGAPSSQAGIQEWAQYPAEQVRREFRQAMEELGYDSIKHEDYDQPEVQPDGSTRYPVNYAIFNPAQVYSGKPPGSSEFGKTVVPKDELLKAVTPVSATPSVPPLPRPTGIDVKYKDATKYDKLPPDSEKEIQRILGTQDPALIGALTNAVDGATVRTTYQPWDGKLATVVAKDGVTAERDFKRKKNGELVVENISFVIADDSPYKGKGTELFARQTQALAEAGAKEIKTDAKRGDGYNGYYTWPRVGYDGPIPKKYLNKMPPELAAQSVDPVTGKSSILRLYETEAGRAWWKENGGSVRLTFDVREGSKSQQVLAKYLAEKQLRPTSKPTVPTVEVPLAPTIIPEAIPVSVATPSDTPIPTARVIGGDRPATPRGGTATGPGGRSRPPLEPDTTDKGAVEVVTPEVVPQSPTPPPPAIATPPSFEIDVSGLTPDQARRLREAVAQGNDNLVKILQRIQKQKLEEQAKASPVQTAPTPTPTEPKPKGFFGKLKEKILGKSETTLVPQAKQFVASLPPLSADYRDALGERPEGRLEPPGGTQKSPWDNSARVSIVGQVRGDRLDEIPKERAKVDPKDLVYTQPGGVVKDKLEDMVGQGPPSKSLRKESGTEPIVIRGKDGKLYAMEGNHRALWHMAYGEKMDAIIVDEKDLKVTSKLPKPTIPVIKPITPSKPSDEDVDLSF